MNYKIYTLNRITSIVAGFEDEIRRKFKDVTFGDRSSYSEIEDSDQQHIEVSENRRDRGRPQRRAQPYPSYQHKLMHEGKVVDEYFVPIPLKCLGDPARIDTTAWDNAQKNHLLTITSNSKHRYFSDRALLEAYWDPSTGGPLTGYPYIRLNSPDFKGYYEILRETKANDEKIILIGYSEGGLVARYLAALDEYVFGEGLIHGIITVGGANYGSPFANPHNDLTVINGVVQLITGALGVSLEEHPKAHAYLRRTRGYDSTKLVKFFDKVIQDKTDRGADYDEMDLFRTAKKWLSGLERRDTTAFFNLNMTDLDDPASTLGFVQDNPLRRIKYGAIVNASNDLDKLLRNALSGVSQVAYSLFFDEDKIADLNEIYTRYLIREAQSSNSPIFQRKIQEYGDGIDIGGPYHLDARIEPDDHDFIIPSVNQLLPPPVPGHDNFCGTIVNEDTNHISGGWHKSAYTKNYRNVLEMLEMIVD